MVDERVLRDWVEFLEEQLGYELDEDEIVDLKTRLDEEERR